MISRFERFVLKRLLLQPCPDRITRGSEEEKRVKCYTIRLISELNEYLLYIEEINDKGFAGTHWNDHERQAYPASVPFDLTGDASVKIERVIGSWRFPYPSILKCVLYDWTYLNRLPIVRDTVKQFFFNRRDLALKKRTNVLRILVEKYYEDPDIIFFEYRLMEILHGSRWGKHPEFYETLIQNRRLIPNHTRIILDSLEESGEVQRVKAGNFFAYKLTGKALTSLETYEREARYHNQIKNLTCALVVVGIIQAAVAYFK